MGCGCGNRGVEVKSAEQLEQERLFAIEAEKLAAERVVEINERSLVAAVENAGGAS